MSAAIAAQQNERADSELADQAMCVIADGLTAQDLISAAPV
jgi:hypothetical protein